MVWNIIWKKRRRRIRNSTDSLYSEHMALGSSICPIFLEQEDYEISVMEALKIKHISDNKSLELTEPAIENLNFQ